MDETAQGEDLTVVGASKDGEVVLNKMRDRGWFETRSAGFKAAAAYAVAQGLTPSESSGLTALTWNVGSLDKTGEFISTLSLLTRQSVSWDYVRRMADSGLKHLAPRVDAAESPSELFGFGLEEE